MTELPTLHYKPGLTLDTPIDITLAAADWLLLMTHFSQDNVPTDSIGHILAIIMPQVRAALFSRQSINAVEAHMQEAREPSNHPVMQMLRQFPFPGAMDMELHRCKNCGRVAGAPTAPCSECEDFQ